MTTDVYFGRKVAATGAAAVLQALDTWSLDVSERGWRDTRLSRTGGRDTERSRAHRPARRTAALSLAYGG
jgi:hypothetical protein